MNIRSADDFTFSGGPGQRLVVLLDPGGIKAVNVLPGGENGNPGEVSQYNRIDPATHYGDLLPKWINGQAVEMRITRQSVAADNQRHVKYVPAAEIEWSVYVVKLFNGLVLNEGVVRDPDRRRIAVEKSAHIFGSADGVAILKEIDALVAFSATVLASS